MKGGLDMDDEIKLVFVGLFVVVIVTIILVIFGGGYTLPYCESNELYVKIDETTGGQPGGGECYCPTDKTLPIGNREAIWVEEGNRYKCVYVK